jgi:hypothetical protein
MRLLANVAVSVSALLALTIVILWIRGYWTTDWMLLVSGRTVTRVESSVGTLQVVFEIAKYDRPGRQPSVRCGSHFVPPPSTWMVFRDEADWEFAGAWHFYLESDMDYLHIWGIPPWQALLPALVLPSAKVGLLIRRRRRKIQGCCPVCGYDLRATPDRCPECGAIPRVELPRPANV